MVDGVSFKMTKRTALRREKIVKTRKIPSLPKSARRNQRSHPSSQTEMKKIAMQMTTTLRRHLTTRKKRG